MNNKNKIISAVAVVVIAGAAFFGGMKYGEAKVPAGAFGRTAFSGGQGGNVQFRGGPGGRGGLGGFLAGSILSKDATSITIGIQDGGSKIVFTSASTTVSKMAAGSMNDLATGTSVIVQGTPNSDGSITAQAIQIRPAGAPAFGGGRTGSGQAPAGQPAQTQ